LTSGTSYDCSVNDTWAGPAPVEKRLNPSRGRFGCGIESFRVVSAEGVWAIVSTSKAKCRWRDARASASTGTVGGASLENTSALVTLTCQYNTRRAHTLSLASPRAPSGEVQTVERSVSKFHFLSITNVASHLIGKVIECSDGWKPFREL
jgi:hypothetical protein